MKNLIALSMCRVSTFLKIACRVEYACPCRCIIIFDSKKYKLSIMLEAVAFRMMNILTKNAYLF